MRKKVLVADSRTRPTRSRRSAHQAEVVEAEWHVAAIGVGGVRMEHLARRIAGKDAGTRHVLAVHLGPLESIDDFLSHFLRPVGGLVVVVEVARLRGHPPEAPSP